MEKNEFFRPENPINSILSRIFDLLILNILWLVCCIPVVTVGASTVALYTMTLNWIAGGDKPVVKGFFTAFRQNFKQGIAVTLILAVVAAVLVTDFHLLGREGSTGGSLLYGFCLVLLILAVALFSYVFPLLAKFENTVRQTFNNAWRLAATHLPYTLVVVFVNVLPFLLFLLLPSVFMHIFWVWLLIGTSVSAYFCSYFMSRVFAELIGEQEDEEDDDEE